MKFYVKNDVFNATCYDENDVPILVFKDVPLKNTLEINENRTINIELDLSKDILTEINQTLSECE